MCIYIYIYVCVFPGLFVYFWAPSGHQPRQPCSRSRFVMCFFSCVAVGRTHPKVCDSLLGCDWRVAEGRLSVYLRVHLIAACGGQPEAAFQDIPVCSLWSCRIWRAAEGRLSVYPWLAFLFFAAYGGRPKAALQCSQVCSWILSCVYDRRSRAAFQNIHVCL